jgi:hypothetical protein
MTKARSPLALQSNSAIPHTLGLHSGESDSHGWPDIVLKHITYSCKTWQQSKSIWDGTNPKANGDVAYQALSFYEK